MSGGIESTPNATAASNVPTVNNSGLESGSITPASAFNKQSVIGDPQTAQTTQIEPLEKTAGESVRDEDQSRQAADSSGSPDLLSGTESKQEEGGLSATQLLSSASETIQQAAGTTAQTATDLANQAFEAVMGSSEKK